MSRQEQERRRALKRARRQLDRQAEEIARAGRRQTNNLPSTRSKQAKWHHDVVNAYHRRRSAYTSMVDRMHAIDAELARKIESEREDPPCECSMSGDTADARYCPAHQERQQWAC